MAGLWTRAGWIAATDAKKVFSNHERSPALVTLDNAIHTYDTATPMRMATAFAQLRTACDAWAGGKAAPSASIRNGTGAVDDLARWLIELEEAAMPAAETGWGGLANCYACAMKCQAPGGLGTPVPGRASGAEVLPYQPAYANNRPAYWRALMAGIVTDGAVAGQAVVMVLSQ